MKTVKSPNYNYVFDDKTGFFARWGMKFEDDPQYSPISTEILDIQVSTICHTGCSFCLAPYTSIVTQSGKKRIDAISVGDHVLSMRGNEVVEDRVAHVSKRFTDEEILEIVLEGDTIIRATKNHEFYSGGEWERAENLSSKDEILASQGTIKIKSIKPVVYYGNVYNIETSPDHNYLIGDVGILSHNCYQSNTVRGKNMSLDTFKSIIDKMDRNLLQIAIATGDLCANPDIWSMMEYARSKGIVPNITISGHLLHDSAVANLVRLAGAVAVSHYTDDVCFNAVKRLTDAGMKQVNIHQLVADETKESCISVMKSYLTDERLKELNAIVFLSLKQKGRGAHFNRILDEDYSKIINFGLDNKIPIGADSCGAKKFLKAIEHRPDFERIEKFIEPCEAGCFSSYVSVDGVFTPCSFLEGVVEGIDMNSVNDFQDDVWYSEKVVEWRELLLNNNRGCPVYEV